MPEATPATTTEETKPAATAPVEGKPAAQHEDEDAALERILGGVDGEAKGEEAKPAADAKPAGDAPDVKIDDALAVAKRDNLGEDVVKAMTPAQRVAYVEAARRRQADVDAYTARLKAAEDKIKELEAAKAPAAPKDEASTDGAQAAGPTGQQPAVEEQQLALKSLGDKVQAAETRALRAEVRAADAVLRAQHGAKAPEFAQVEKRMAELGAANPGKYADIAELASAAYSSLVTPAKSSPGVQPGSARRGQAASSEGVDRDDVVLDLLLNGKRDEAFAVART